MESKQKFVKRGPCEGVKVYSAENCSHTVANTQLRNECEEHGSVKPLRYQGIPNDNIAFSPFERQAFHKHPNKLCIF